MIPLKDMNPRLSTPFVTLLIVVANVLVFFYQLSLPPPAEMSFIYTFGMIPARLPAALGSASIPLVQALSPLLTSMFLHGGWLHIIGNMWFLWIFGDNIEDAMGHFGYLAFYLICGIGAGLAHTFANLGSTVPSVGASGAISGVMGAYIVLYPKARVLTLVPLVFFFFTVQLPAFVILGYWFLIQFVSGVLTAGGPNTGGTAWWAHIGGFLLGIVLVHVFRRR